MFADFIRNHINDILDEWDRFAETIPVRRSLDKETLRNSAKEILLAIAEDMGRPQTDEEQEAKSKGKGLRVWAGGETSPEQHGATRLVEGFSLVQMVSEYRALRASVIRLWTRNTPNPERDSLYELTRFNEGIDQALSESVMRYTADLDHSREMFLAVLGHDLRNPLGVMMISANGLLTSGLPNAQTTFAAKILSSGARMQHMIGQLLDVAQIRLGGWLSLNRQPSDLSVIYEQVVLEARALHPSATLRSNNTGSLRGVWDGPRIAQMLSNLLENALEHGAQDKPVTVSADRTRDEIVFTLHNEGEPIPEATLSSMFQPLVWSEDARTKRASSSGLGLGLYIACEIAKAHGGRIDVQSAKEMGTRFTVVLPQAANNAELNSHN